MLSFLLLIVLPHLSTSGIIYKAIDKNRCGLYEVYKICGSTCPFTCDTLKDKVCCPVICVPGCFCIDGYMLETKDGPRKCVPIFYCPRPGILRFESATITFSEGDRVTKIPVVRVNGTKGTVTVQWGVEGPPAYQGNSGVLTFPDGVDRQYIQIPIQDDQVRFYPDVTFKVKLFNPSNKAEVSSENDQIEVTIEDDDMKPGYLEMAKTDIPVQENAGTVQVNVVRKGGSDGQITIRYRTVPGTAREFADFTPASGKLVFEEEETVKSIRVVIVDDDVREGPKTFQVQLFDPQAGPGVRNFRPIGVQLITTILIKDDDMKPGYLELEMNNLVVPEKAGKARIKVVRYDGTDGQLKAKYRAVATTAGATSDFEPIEGDLIFEEGETSKFIDVSIIDDNIFEKAEKFRLELFDPSTGPGVINFRDRGTIHSVEVTIIDDDMQPGSFEVEKVSITTPESRNVSICVIRVGGTDGVIGVKLNTVPRTALAGEDFKPRKGLLVFRDGDTRKCFVVAIFDDDVREPAEVFEVVLVEATPGPDVVNFRGLGERTVATVTITDDDMTPGTLELEQPDYTINENVGTVKVPVIRTGGSDGVIRVLYKTVPRTALDGQDFQHTSGELIFKDGETVRYLSIRINDDDVREPLKAFDVVLYESTAAPGVINFRGLGGRKVATISITDDDMNPGTLELEKPSYTILENAGQVRIGVTRVGGSDGEIRVQYKTVPKTALVGLDFLQTSGELVFKEGEILKFITVPIANDDAREPSKDFELVLSDPAASLGVINFRGLGKRRAATISITDDDMNPGTLELEKPSYTILENAGQVRIGVTRVGGSDGEIRVQYKTVPKTALVGLDFLQTSGELFFKEGETLKFITIPIANDDVREPSKDFELVLSDPAAAQGVINFRGLGKRRAATISITDDDMRPGYLEVGKTSMTVRENAGKVMTCVVRLDGSDGEIRVSYQTVAQSAAEGTDFQPSTGELVFEEKTIKKCFYLTILNDDVREPVKVFHVVLSDSGAGPGVINFRGLGTRRRTSISITDDDMSPGYLELEKASYKVRESDGTLKIGVVRLDGSDGRIQVHYKTVPTTALESTDFEPVSGELVFEEGEKIKYFDVRIKNDEVWEPAKNFRVELYDSLAGPNVINFRGIGQRGFSTITIDDDDRKPGYLQLGRASYSTAENVGHVRVDVVRVGGSDGEIRVRLKTVSRTATAVLDFQPLDVQLVFGDKETAKSVQVPIVDDDVREPSEKFEIRLYGAVAVPGDLGFRVLGPTAVADVTIEDNDKHAGVLEFEQTNIAVPEDIGEVRVTVMRTGGDDGILVAKYRTIDGTAQAGNDYAAAEGEIVLQEGENTKTITISIVDDQSREPLENFQVQIFTDDPRTRRTTTITVIDNDAEHPGTFEFRETSVRVLESERKAVLTVLRTGGAEGSSTLTWRTIDGTASRGFDYVEKQGNLAFNDGETEKSFAIDIVDDAVREGEEQFVVGLFDPTRGRIGFRSMVIVTITDEDRDVPSTSAAVSNTEFYFTEMIVRANRISNVVRFYIGRSGNLEEPMTVFVQTQDGTAKGGVDYRKTKGKVRFDRNQIELTIQISLIEGRNREFGKYFLVKLSDPSEGSVVPSKAILVALIDEDTPRSHDNAELKTISEADFDFDISGRRTAGGSSNSASSSSSGEFRFQTTGTTKRCNKCKPGSIRDSSGIPNIQIPGSNSHGIRTPGTGIDLPSIGTSNSNSGLSGSRTSSSNIGLTGVGGINNPRANIGIPGTGVSIPGIPSLQGISGIQIPGTSGSRTSSSNIGIPGTGVSIPGIPSLQGISGIQIPGISGSRTSSSNIGIPGTGVNIPGIPSLQGISGIQIPGTGGNVQRISEFQNFGSQRTPITESNSRVNMKRPETRVQCPTGMTFRTCAPTCPLTCDTLKRRPCDKKCINACFCPDGLVIENLQTLRCIPPSMCKANIGVAVPPPTNTGVGGLLGGLGGLGGILG